MEIHILGTVGLWSGGQRIKLGSDKERCILAALALERDHPIAAATLEDRVWDSHPPPRARENIHTYISRLRRALRLTSTEPAAVRITQRAHTYTLEVEPDCIDWHRYQRLVAQARAIADQGDDTRSVTLFHEADNLWSGEALAGLPGIWPERARTTMAEKRLNATMSRIALELRLGRFADVIADLSALIDQHPGDETLLGDLMVAHYGCGRHTDALRIYQNARRVLRVEFGTDPGHELIRIHRHILNRAPVQELVGSSQAGTDASVLPPPRNLPRHTPLVGRQAELQSLFASIATAAEEGTIVTLEAISGMAGVGKSAVAIHAAHQLGEKFPDGQLYINLRAHAPAQEPLSPQAALAALLRLLGVPAGSVPSDIEEGAALWRTMLARRRTVIVLDDAADVDQIRPLLPGASPSLTIITSRRHLTGLPNARSVALDVLPVADAIALFRRLAGEDRTHDTEEITQIVHYCGCLPLAIEIVASRFDSRPSWDLATLTERLARESSRLSEIRDGYREVAHAFQFSYQTLSDDQRAAFRRLGLHAGSEFDVHVAAALMGTRPQAAERLLEDLMHHNLLKEPRPHRYRFHDLLGEYARTLALNEDSQLQRDRAEQRLIDYWLCASDQADRILYPRRLRLDVHPIGPLFSLPEWRDVDHAKAWFTTEHFNLLAAHKQTRTRGALDEAALLSHTLAGFLDAECYWTHAVGIHEYAANHWQRSGNQPALCRALLDLSITYANIGRYTQAAAAGEQALDLTRGIADTEAEAEACRALGVLNWHLGQNRIATQFHHESLKIHTALGNVWGRASCHNNLAISMLSLGQYDLALENFQAAQRGFESTGDQRSVSRTLNNAGDLYFHMGDLERARESYEKSLSLAMSIGSRSDQATVQLNLAGVLSASGDFTLALGMYAQCLLAFRRLEDRKNQANTHNGMGATRRALGNADEAAAHHQNALAIAQEIGAAREEVHSRCGLGAAELARNRPEHASEHLEAAVAIAHSIQAADEEAKARRALAEIRIRAGRVCEARTLLRQAFDLLHAIDAEAAGEISHRLSQIDHLVVKLPGPANIE